jgi:NAD(P)-dependent dehydrogenase (short-subunit alcohol dehydrogenase family)
MSKTIFITGSSSGLGKASAKYFAENGWNVAATMRSPEKETELTKYSNIKIFKLDVTNLEQVHTATQEAIAAFGKIDVVVNNAGMGVYGALELASEADIDWQFAVNTRGPINVIRAFLPHFRAHGGGMFINISSLVGLATMVPLGSLYTMSKFALEGLSEALYYELKPQHIDIRLVEQVGYEDNNFKDNMIWNGNSEIAAYNELSEKLQQKFKSPGKLDDIQDVVKVVASLANRENNNFRNIIGPVATQLISMRNAMPIEQYLDTIDAMYK